MSGPLLGWLVLMLQLEGVEMIYGGDSPPGRFNEGRLAQRIPWSIHAHAWQQVDDAHVESQSHSLRPVRSVSRIGEDRDHRMSEPARYDDGTVL